MSAITNRRTFLEAAHAYTRAREPTTSLTLALLTAFAQMMADDCGGEVAVALPGDVRIVRRAGERE